MENTQEWGITEVLDGREQSAFGTEWGRVVYGCGKEGLQDAAQLHGIIIATLGSIHRDAFDAAE